jgi:hypothetical protein
VWILSPHILIDDALESLEHPSSAYGETILVQRIITKMMTDHLITLEEFSHYCKRLNKITTGRREAA